MPDLDCSPHLDFNYPRFFSNARAFLAKTKLIEISELETIDKILQRYLQIFARRGHQGRAERFIAASCLVLVLRRRNHYDCNLADFLSKYEINFDNAFAVNLQICGRVIRQEVNNFYEPASDQCMSCRQLAVLYQENTDENICARCGVVQDQNAPYEPVISSHLDGD